MLQKADFVILILAISLVATNLPAQIVEDGLAVAPNGKLAGTWGAIKARR